LVDSSLVSISVLAAGAAHAVHGYAFVLPGFQVKTNVCLAVTLDRSKSTSIVVLGDSVPVMRADGLWRLKDLRRQVYCFNPL
jgi:hypothetical protein